MNPKMRIHHRHRQQAFLYRRLATLRRDVPLQEEVDDLEWRGARATLKDLCHDSGDEAFLKRIPHWQI
ncbi:MAG: hypothetical protein V1774_10845 [Candidatus Eisenbacteria bacterium]